VGSDRSTQRRTVYPNINQSRTWKRKASRPGPSWSSTTMTSTTAISPSDLDGTDAEDFFSTFIQTLEPHPLIHSPGIVSYGNVAVEAAPKGSFAFQMTMQGLPG
jgi:hypothetical protein